MKSFINRVTVIFAATGFGAGVGVGLLIGKKRTDKAVKEAVEEAMQPKQMELFSSIESIDGVHRRPLPIDPELEALLEQEEDIEARKIIRRRISTPVGDPVQKLMDNVFDNPNSDWDYEAERSSRTDKEPYIIHVEEYFNNEMGFKQRTFTYYEGDDILVDEHDQPQHNHRRIVGELQFGHGSGDRNVVYVRNEEFKTEFEIMRVADTYQSVVLGIEAEEEIEAELKHSMTHRKFRASD